MTPVMRKQLGLIFPITFGIILTPLLDIWRFISPVI